MGRLFRGSRITETLVNINIHHLMVSIMVLILHCQKVHQLKRRRMVKVTRIFNNELGGKVLQIAEDNGEYHQWYLHLDKYNIKVGDRVKAGDIIAYSGNTGKTNDRRTFTFSKNEGWRR